MTKRNYFSVVILTLLSFSFSQTPVSVGWTSNCFADYNNLTVSVNTTGVPSTFNLKINDTSKSFNVTASNMQLYKINDTQKLDQGLYNITESTLNNIKFIPGEINKACLASFCIDKSSAKTMIIDSSDRKDGYFKKFSFKVESYDTNNNQTGITFRIGNKTDEAQELTCTRNLTTINCDTSGITFKKDDVKTTRKFKLYLNQCNKWYDTSYHIEVKDTSSLFISISKMLIFTFFIIF